MRNLSSTLTDKLSKKFGLSTTVYVGIDWNGGGETLYSSEASDKAQKALIDLGGMDTATLVSGNGASQSVTITLSDTDGTLTDLLNRVDIHKRPAKVYLGFDGLDSDQSVVMLDGEVNSPIEWDEHARTLRLTIVNKIEGRLFGFAMEDGYFLRVPDKYRNAPWPFRFGNTCAYPAVRVANGTTGTLLEGQGVLDPSLDARICQAQQINCPTVSAGAGLQAGVSPLTEAQNITQATITWGQADFFENDPTTPFGEKVLPDGASSQFQTDPYGNSTLSQPDAECERAKFTELCQLLRDRANQLVYVNSTLEVLGGEKFPQGETVTIQVNDVTYTGTFAGQTFTIATTDRMDAPTSNPDCAAATDPYLGYSRGSESEPGSLAECATPTTQLELVVIGGAGDAWRNLGNMRSPGFRWLPAGTDVRLTNDATEVHVVSMVPGTVEGVYAYRTLGDVSQLTELPTDYYSVAYVDYGGYLVSEIHIARPLDSYAENWEDTIYAAFDSDIGPNPVAVLEYLTNNYTDFTVDTDSFVTATSQLANYPCNFYYASKSNVLQVMQKIAYEARCALYVTDGVVKIKYLSAEPSSDRTISGGDILAGSFSYELTSTENLTTSSKVTWRASGASILKDEGPDRTFTVENNVSKYGWTESTDTYDTISDEDQAIKTATFWSIRNSNSWREIKFTTTLEHLDLELFDCITIDIPQFPTVKTVIRDATVNPTDGTIDFTAWTPILSGTNQEYKWAWPALKGVEPYPVSATDYVAEGIVVTPPVGHPLYIDDPNAIVPPIVGDLFPTDADDTFPVQVCPDVTDPLVKDAIEPDFKTIDFDQQATRAEENTEEGLSWGSGGEDNDNVVCGRPSLESAVYEVVVQYSTATLIAQKSGTSGAGIDNCTLEPGPCRSTASGARCGGDNFFWCRTFGSESIAQAFADSIRQEINGSYCSWTTGKTGPVGVVGPTKKGDGEEIDVELGKGEI